MAKGNSNTPMSNAVIEEIIQQLMRGKTCVCKPFCGHWEAHAAKVLSKYLPTTTPTDPPPRHHKNCSIWTVTRDGDKNVCDCGFERKQFQEHLEYASKLAATWQPWERHIFSSAPCGIEGCPCSKIPQSDGDQRGVVPCRCASTPEIKWLLPSNCPEGLWVARCVNGVCGIKYFALTRDEAIEYWNSQQIDVEPYPFGRVGQE